MRGRGTASIAASPILIGAVTLLVTVVAVFLAYNANQGLPFVPTYELRAQLPSGSGLVVGNDVRLGGNRVGQISELSTARAEIDGRPVSVAEVALKLDQSLDPLPEDTTLVVRPRSALGLKYIDLTPGTSEEGLQPGDRIALSSTQAPVELEDVLSTFDAETRAASRESLAGYGDAFAGRGEDINRTLAALRPLVVNLEPVMRTLSDPDTELDQLFLQLGRAAAEAAPVAEVQARLFGNMATTFAAIARDPEALRQTIERSPPALDAAISSFRVQRPFLARFEALSRELRPVARQLDRSLPPLNRALRAGRDSLVDAPRTNRLTADVLEAIGDVGADPNSILALRDLDTLIDVAEPLVSFVAPYQTVCNFFNYFVTPLGTHLSESVPGGTIERIQLITTNNEQDDRLGSNDADRPADVPQGQDPKTATTASGQPLTRLTTQFYGPAIDAAGNADCQTGQTGWPEGPLNSTGRYPPSPDPQRNGGSHVLIDPDTPGLAGGTYVSRRLGIDNIEDVP